MITHGKIETASQKSSGALVELDEGTTARVSVNERPTAHRTTRTILSTWWTPRSSGLRCGRHTLLRSRPR